MNREPDERTARPQTAPLPPIVVISDRDAELARVAEELEEVQRRIGLIRDQVRWIQRAEVPSYGER